MKKILTLILVLTFSISGVNLLGTNVKNANAIAFDPIEFISGQTQTLNIAYTKSIDESAKVLNSIYTYNPSLLKSLVSRFRGYSDNLPNTADRRDLTESFLHLDNAFEDLTTSLVNNDLLVSDQEATSSFNSLFQNFTYDVLTFSTATGYMESSLESISESVDISKFIYHFKNMFNRIQTSDTSGTYKSSILTMIYSYLYEPKLILDFPITYSFTTPEDISKQKVSFTASALLKYDPANYYTSTSSFYPITSNSSLVNFEISSTIGERNGFEEQVVPVTINVSSIQGVPTTIAPSKTYKQIILKAGSVIGTLVINYVEKTPNEVSTTASIIGDAGTTTVLSSLDSTFSSSNTKVATVDANGVVQGLSGGTVTVWAIDKILGTSGTAVITIESLVKPSVKIKGTTKVGKTLTASFTKVSGVTYSYKWTSKKGSSKSTLKLDKGDKKKYVYVTVTAKKVGYKSVSSSKIKSKKIS